ncbi:hypothetical protein [Clostridium gasigenes]|uniref:Uncharacterized protein n=1 Tax=Clostridium gasigenes TaxID=94869 RepID=A0A7X0S9E7_9CLOT|nr:hypothetical protein [Clostridium gasigenes]MBB6713425.1 hypothetical protein [Clostridium gasigenes]
MMDIIILIGVILSIVLIVIGNKKNNKIFISIGVVLILICLGYMAQDFFKGFIHGFINGDL